MNEISNSILKSASASFGNDLYTFLKSKFLTMNYKNQGDFSEKLQEYFMFSVEKIGKVKTLFYDKKAQPLLDFYEPLKVRDENNTSGIYTNTSSVSYFMRKENNIIFTGNGGCGKTMLLKYLFLNSISEEFKIPIYIELRNLNNFSGSLVEFIYQTIQEMHFNISEDHFEYTLSGDKYLFLFDAFDEVYPEKAETLSSEIRQFSNKYSSNTFVLSSRLSQGFIDWSDFTEFSICPMNKEQALSLISKINVHKDIKEEFLKDLKRKLFKKYKSFASSPLLLTIMLITYESTSTLPDKLNGFYEKAFEALFYSHDLSKNRYKRKLKSKLGYEEAKKIFSRVCFKSYMKNEFTFNFDSLMSLIEDAKQIEKINEFRSEDFINDLETCLCMLIKEGFEYSYTHRSFQEYFAASFIEGKADEDQVKIFRIMFKETTNALFGIQNFWYIISDMQKERFIKNMIVPSLISFEVEQDKLKTYISDLYSEVSLVDEKEDEKIFEHQGIIFTAAAPKIEGFALGLFNTLNLCGDEFMLNYASATISKEHELEKRRKLKKMWFEQFDTRNVHIEKFLNEEKVYLYCLNTGELDYRKNEVERYLLWIKEYRRLKQDSEQSDDIFIDSL